MKSNETFATRAAAAATTTTTTTTPTMTTTTTTMTMTTTAATTKAICKAQMNVNRTAVMVLHGISGCEQF